mmetsp:Transcript_75738/g.201227  ORF Transcript_75738/g.201227 Transcript_75738/m.201227 type:complete len:228 (-) Transcript_75738:29-712(-)
MSSESRCGALPEPQRCTTSRCVDMALRLMKGVSLICLTPNGWKPPPCGVEVMLPRPQSTCCVFASVWASDWHMKARKSAMTNQAKPSVETRTCAKKLHHASTHHKQSEDALVTQCTMPSFMTEAHSKLERLTTPVVTASKSKTSTMSQYSFECKVRKGAAWGPCGTSTWLKTTRLATLMANAEKVARMLVSSQHLVPSLMLRKKSKPTREPSPRGVTVARHPPGQGA